MKYPEYRMYMEAALPSPVHSWLRQELELRGIDSLVYTRYIISLLQQEPEQLDMFDREVDLLCKPGLDLKKKGRRYSSISEEQKKKSAAIECLSAVADERTSIVRLVEELCSRLKDNNDTVEEGSSTHQPEIESQRDIPEETYYEAFPSLHGRHSPVSPTAAVSVSSVWSNNPLLKANSQTSLDHPSNQGVSPSGQSADKQTTEESCSPAAEEVKKINNSCEANSRRKHRGRQHQVKDNHEYHRHVHGRSKSAGRNRNSGRAKEDSHHKNACQRYPPGFHQAYPEFSSGMCEEEIQKIIAACGYCPDWTPAEVDTLEIKCPGPHNKQCHQAECQIKSIIFSHGEKDYKELEDVHDAPEELRERIEKIHIAPHESVSPELQERDSWYSMPVPRIQTTKTRLFDRNSESNSPVELEAIGKSSPDPSRSPGNGRPRSHSAPSEDIWHLWQDLDLFSGCIDGDHEGKSISTDAVTSTPSFPSYGVMSVKNSRTYGFEAGLTSDTPTWADIREDDPTPTPADSIVRPDVSEDYALFHTDHQMVSVILPQPVDVAGWQLPSVTSPQYVQSDDLVHQDPFSGLVWSQPSHFNSAHFPDWMPEPEVPTMQPASNIHQCLPLLRAREGQSNGPCCHLKLFEADFWKAFNSVPSAWNDEPGSVSSTEAVACLDNVEANPEWNVDDFDELDVSEAINLIQAQQFLLEGLVSMIADDNATQSTEMRGSARGASAVSGLDEDKHPIPGDSMAIDNMQTGQRFNCSTNAPRNPKKESDEQLIANAPKELGTVGQAQHMKVKKDFNNDQLPDNVDSKCSVGYCTSQLWDVNLQKVTKSFWWDCTGIYTEFNEDKQAHCSLDQMMNDYGSSMFSHADNTLIPEISIDVSDGYAVAEAGDEEDPHWLPLFNRSVSLSDAPLSWDGYSLHKVPNPRLSKSFELVPSECSAFNDVPKGLFHVRSEPDLARLRWESTYLMPRRPVTPQNEIQINPHTHFRPITPAYAPELSSPRSKKDSVVNDVFGGAPSTKTPYQRYQTVKEDSDDDDGFVVRFKVRHTCKGVQTGDSIDEPDSLCEEEENERDTPETLTRGMIDELIQEKDDADAEAESDSGLGFCPDHPGREYQLFENHPINSVQACYSYMQEWPSVSYTSGVSAATNCDCQRDLGYWPSSDIEGNPVEYIHPDESTVDVSVSGDWDYSSSWKETVDIDQKFGDGEPYRYTGIWSSGECAYPGEFVLKYSSGEEEGCQDILPEALLVHLGQNGPEEGVLDDDGQSKGLADLNSNTISSDQADEGKPEVEPILKTDDGFDEEDGYMKVKIVYKHPLPGQGSTPGINQSKHSFDESSDWAPIPGDAKLSTELEEEWMNPDVQASMWLSSRYPGSQIKPCSFYLEGNCWRDSDCKFSHDLSNITCKHWEVGVCFKGPLCPFRHAYDSSQYRSAPSGSSTTETAALAESRCSSGCKQSQSFSLEKEDFPELSLSIKNENNTPKKDQPWKSVNVSHAGKKEKNRKGGRRHSNKENEEKLRHMSRFSSSV